MDINPLVGLPSSPEKILNLVFDTCRMTFSGPGVTTAGPGAAWVGPGSEPNPDEAASIRLEVSTADGRPFSPDDIAISRLTPVQSVYEPRFIIADKATALMAEFGSSWAVAQSAVVSATLSDGLTTVTDRKTVTIPPGGTRVIFFDGSGEAGPFFPRKVPGSITSGGGTGTLAYTVSAEISNETIDRPVPHPFENCPPTANNQRSGTHPIIATQDLFTLYLPWDWADRAGSIAPVVPSIASVMTTASANERLRLAAFPLATVNSAVAPVPAISSYPLVPGTEALEPFITMMGADVAASAVGIGRIVLMPRNGWFFSNGISGTNRLSPFANNAIGLSLAEFVPRAVIAEQGFSQVAVHEIGHALTLSQRKCRDGGIGEFFLNAGCRDEYTHTAADGAPYIGQGYDVLGMVYPTGFGGLLGTREVIANNIMTTTGMLDGSYDRWLDTFSYDILSEKLRLPNDPPLISVAGYIKVDGALDEPAKISTSGQLFTSYRFDGIPDIVQGKSQEAVGDGLFVIRILTSTAGEAYLYRFIPQFEVEGNQTKGYGFFAFTVPWPANAQRIELTRYDLADTSQPTLLEAMDSLEQSKSSPKISDLKASAANSAASVAIEGALPTFTADQSITLEWQAEDADTEGKALRAMVYLIPPANPVMAMTTIMSETTKLAIPVAVEVQGNQITLQSNQLRNALGDYGAKLLVSDGINTTELEVPKLFTVTARELVSPTVQVFLPIVNR